MSGKEFIFKIVVIGDAAVGKSTLIHRFIKDKFKEDYRPTLGADLLRKQVEIEFEDKKFNCTLVLWDIAGQDRYKMIRALYFNGCVGAILVYDCTRLKTFENIKSIWLNDLLINAEENVSHILIGNKIDLEDLRLVSSEEGKEMAEEIKSAEFIETSAKTGENVENAFKSLVIEILKKLGEIN
jgi:Ras-related protein Rab-11A